MAVKARFYVSELKRQAYNPNATTVTLNAVSRGEHNKVWASATPVGTLSMTVNNESAAGFFSERLGTEVEITIEEAPQE